MCNVDLTQFKEYMYVKVMLPKLSLKLNLKKIAERNKMGSWESLSCHNVMLLDNA